VEVDQARHGLRERFAERRLRDFGVGDVRDASVEEVRFLERRKQVSTSFQKSLWPRLSLIAIE
jgi:hypothetical protein